MVLDVTQADPLFSQLLQPSSETMYVADSARNLVRSGVGECCGVLQYRGLRSPVND